MIRDTAVRGVVAEFAARNTGARFVQNVLAMHASRKVGNPRAVKTSAP